MQQHAILMRRLVALSVLHLRAQPPTKLIHGHQNLGGSENSRLGRNNRLQNRPSTALHTSIPVCMSARENALCPTAYIKTPKPSSMHDPLPPSSSTDVFQRCGDYALDDSTVLVYRSAEVHANDALKRCAHAEESYARKVLNWPKGRLAKTTIFDHTATVSESLEACAAHFIRLLSQLVKRASPDQQKTLAVYPFAFIFVEQEHPVDQVTVVLAVASEQSGDWRLCPCRIPIEVELGSQLDSLRMCDVTAKDLVALYSGSSPLSAIEVAATTSIP